MSTASSPLQRFACPVALAFLLAGAGCSPAKPKGPQPTGVTSRAYVGDAELMVRYRYEPEVGKEMVFYVDAVGKRGTVGKVRIDLRLTGFTVIRGEPKWVADVAPTRTDTHQLILRATDRVATVTIVTHHVERDVELATDEVRFYVDEDGRLSECEPTVDACK